MASVLRSWCVVVCTVVYTGLVLGAQDKPDFAGTWFAAAGQTLAPGTTAQLTVRPLGNDPGAVLAVERRSAAGTTSDVYSVGAIGGVISGSGSRARQTRLEVVWRGQTLVIFSGEYSGADRAAGPYSEVAEEWTLDARGQLVIATTRRATGQDVAVTTLVYRRQ